MINILSNWLKVPKVSLLVCLQQWLQVVKSIHLQVDFTGPVYSIVRRKIFDVDDDNIVDLFSNIAAVKTSPSVTPQVAQVISSCSVYCHVVLLQKTVKRLFPIAMRGWRVLIKHHQSEQWKLVLLWFSKSCKRSVSWKNHVFGFCFTNYPVPRTND